MDKLWSITTFVHSTGWLIFPSSVETIALQLQPDLFVVFGAVAFATLLVSKLTFAKTLSPFTMILPRPLSALLEIFQNAGQFWFFERQVGNVRHVNPLTVVVFKTRCTHLRVHRLQCRGNRPCRSTQSRWCCQSNHR